MLNNNMRIGTYIFIKVTNADARTVYTYIAGRLPVDLATLVEDHGIILNVPAGGCGFTLNELKKTIARVADASVIIGDVYSDGEVVQYDIS